MNEFTEDQENCIRWTASYLSELLDIDLRKPQYYHWLIEAIEHTGWDEFKFCNSKHNREIEYFELWRLKVESKFRIHYLMFTNEYKAAYFLKDQYHRQIMNLELRLNLHVA